MKRDHWSKADQEALEKEIQAHALVCGIDEVGRGPLAGPVLACAIIMPKGRKIEGVRDSKKLSERKRERLCGQILSSALAIGIGMRHERVIDAINIRRATLEAMQEALAALHDQKDQVLQPDLVLIDAEHLEIPYPQQSIIKGDDRVYAISCASIVAKVFRDFMMRTYDLRFPQYGFARHKGYGTKAHLEAIRKEGLLPIHRMSFIHLEGVKKHAAYEQEAARLSEIQSSYDVERAWRLGGAGRLTIL